MLDSCVAFFSRMVKTPVGVLCPCAPVLTVERPMRTPLRNTNSCCSGMLTTITTGPAGEGMWFVNGAFLGTLRLQLQNGREHGHHKNCWKAKTSRWAYGRCS